MDSNDDLKQHLEFFGEWGFDGEGGLGKKLSTDDWNYLHQLVQLSIVDLCALSVGVQPYYARFVQAMTAIDPDASPDSVKIEQVRAFYDDNEWVSEWERRVRIAINHVNARTLRFGDGDPHEPIPADAENTRVKVDDFIAWALGLGWSLPEEFTKPANETAPIATPRVNDALISRVMVPLPHTNNKLDAVFEIMRTNWTNYDPKRPPKQTNIAAEIDQALGWRAQKDGSPSRNAKAIATLLKPDAAEDTE